MHCHRFVLHAKVTKLQIAIKKKASLVYLGTAFDTFLRILLSSYAVHYVSKSWVQLSPAAFIMVPSNTQSSSSSTT